jgi:ribonuclease HI
MTKETDNQIVALYADGGCILKNPSTIGGTWAWCAVDEHGARVIERGGVTPATETREITNNHMEQIAITLALEAMPDGWSGKVYSDSQLALGRVFKGWRIRNLPSNVAKRSAAAVARLGRIEIALLQGHPTKADLARGIGARRGLPVSEHNVWADEECRRQAKAYLEKQKQERVEG